MDVFDLTILVNHLLALQKISFDDDLQRLVVDLNLECFTPVDGLYKEGQSHTASLHSDIQPMMCTLGDQVTPTKLQTKRHQAVAFHFSSTYHIKTIMMASRDVTCGIPKRERPSTWQQPLGHRCVDLTFDWAERYQIDLYIGSWISKYTCCNSMVVGNW